MPATLACVDARVRMQPCSTERMPGCRTIGQEPLHHSRTSYRAKTEPVRLHGTHVGARRSLALPCRGRAAGGAPLGRREAQERGRRAQRASCSVSPRLSERSERSERSELRGATPLRASQRSRRAAPTVAVKRRRPPTRGTAARPESAAGIPSPTADSRQPIAAGSAEA